MQQTDDKLERKDSGPIEVVRIDDKDWHLQNLVSMTTNGIEIGVTLNVGGFLVSGILIGGKKYFELFGNAMASGMGDTDSSTSIRDMYKKLGEETYAEPEDGCIQQAPSYIHLKDAKFYASNELPIANNGGALWRGQISEVGGFILGNLMCDANK